MGPDSPQGHGDTGHGRGQAVGDQVSLSEMVGWSNNLFGYLGTGDSSAVACDHP